MRDATHRGLCCLIAWMASAGLVTTVCSQEPDQTPPMQEQEASEPSQPKKAEPPKQEPAEPPKEEAVEPAKPREKNIVETVASHHDLGMFAAALTIAELQEMLKKEGPFTIFAPTDRAFLNLPGNVLDEVFNLDDKEKRRLMAIVKYHLVSGKYLTADLQKRSSLKTWQGSNLAIATKEGRIDVDDAHIITADLLCGNGVIHVIDAVLEPK